MRGVGGQKERRSVSGKTKSQSGNYGGGEVWGANRLALLGMNTAGREINQERVFVFSSADLSRSAG